MFSTTFYSFQQHYRRIVCATGWRIETSRWITILGIVDIPRVLYVHRTEAAHSQQRLQLDGICDIRTSVADTVSTSFSVSFLNTYKKESVYMYVNNKESWQVKLDAAVETARITREAAEVDAERITTTKRPQTSSRCLDPDQRHRMRLSTSLFYTRKEEPTNNYKSSTQSMIR